jgi:ribonuclease P protein component
MRRIHNEQKNLSAEQDQAQKDLRLPCPHEHQEWPQRVEPAPGQGSSKIVGLSFPKRNRLLSRPEFLACYDGGRRLNSRHFIAYVLPHGQGSWRLGLAVTRKVGSAVSRNRIKRVLREFFRLHQHELSELMDIVVVPKRHVDASSLDLHQVEAELTPMLARAGLLASEACAAREGCRRGAAQGGG